MEGPTRASQLLGPEEILALAPEGADRLLDRLEREVPVEPTFFRLPLGAAREAVVFGDTHGDWRSTLAATGPFLEAPADRFLVGLGDYIDRPPDDCPNGSVANALYLLELAAAFPARVVLLQGNHETARRVAVLPHSLAEELDDLWGPRAERYARLMSLLERGPWALVTGSGLYLAHGGFPGEGRRLPGSEEGRPTGEELLFDLVWRDASESRVDRGTAAPFTAEELRGFLGRIGARLFLRGHDPTLAGRWICGQRCLTLHTTRVYESYGGVLRARFALDRAVKDPPEVSVEHLQTEGRSYPVD